MLTRPHTPGAWWLAACGLAAITTWAAAGAYTAWENRSQLTDRAIRHLNRLTKEPS